MMRSGVSRAAWRRLVALSLLAGGGGLPGSGTGAAVDADCMPHAGREPYSARVFLGYACREPRCAAHKQGFRWADRHGIADAGACAIVADGPAMREGCRAYAEFAVTPEQAGFEWARENEVADACLCQGAGPAFAAGCEAYVTGFGE